MIEGKKYSEELTERIEEEKVHPQYKDGFLEILEIIRNTFVTIEKGEQK